LSSRPIFRSKQLYTLDALLSNVAMISDSETSGGLRVVVHDDLAHALRGLKSLTADAPEGGEQEGEEQRTDIDEEQMPRRASLDMMAEAALMGRDIPWPSEESEASWNQYRYNDIYCKTVQEAKIANEIMNEDPWKSHQSSATSSCRGHRRHPKEYDTLLMYICEADARMAGALGTLNVKDDSVDVEAILDSSIASDQTLSSFEDATDLIVPSVGKVEPWSPLRGTASSAMSTLTPQTPSTARSSAARRNARSSAAQEIKACSPVKQRSRARRKLDFPVLQSPRNTKSVASEPESVLRSRFRQNSMPSKWRCSSELSGSTPLPEKRPLSLPTPVPERPLSLPTPVPDKRPLSSDDFLEFGLSDAYGVDMAGLILQPPPEEVPSSSDTLLALGLSDASGADLASDEPKDYMRLMKLAGLPDRALISHSAAENTNIYDRPPVSLPPMRHLTSVLTSSEHRQKLHALYGLRHLKSSVPSVGGRSTD